MASTLFPPRRWWLPAVALLHLAALLGLRRPLPMPSETARREGVLTFVLPPRAMPPQVASPRAPDDRPARAVRPRQVAPPQAALPPLARPPSTAPDAAAVPPLTPPAGKPSADPFALPSEPGDTLLARSRSAAGGADRQLRQERRETLALQESELARKFGAAYIDRSHKITETVLPNGDVLMKVQSPFGTYCWMKWGNSFQGGRDPFRDTGKQFAVQCPK